MGSTTAVKTQPFHNSKRPNFLTSGLDLAIIFIILALLALGLVILYSASMPVAFYASETASPMDYVAKQGLYAALGLVVAFIISLIDYRKLQKWMMPALLGTWLLLFLVLIIGTVRHGATRTFFNGSVQPSEIAKVVIILYLAFWLKSKQDNLKHLTFWAVPIGFVLGLTLFLLYLEPDYSAILTLIAISAVMLFMADLDWKQIILIGGVASVFFVGIIKATNTGSVRWNQFVSGFKDPYDAISQVKRAIESLVDGGLFGVGIGQGTVKFTGLEVGQSDTIFTVVAEEMGLLGCMLVIGLFLLFFLRGLKIALQSTDMAGKLIASGISIWIITEAFLNIASLFNMVPVGGNTLPFFSLGGSSLVSILTGVGFLLSVSRMNYKDKYSERNPFNAVVDLRWRDRRRSVSGARRSSSNRKQGR
jgi:cell division protein FtsW